MPWPTVKLLAVLTVHLAGRVDSTSCWPCWQYILLAVLTVHLAGRVDSTSCWPCWQYILLAVLTVHLAGRVYSTSCFVSGVWMTTTDVIHVSLSLSLEIIILVVHWLISLMSARAQGGQVYGWPQLMLYTCPYLQRWRSLYSQCIDSFHSCLPGRKAAASSPRGLLGLKPGTLRPCTRRIQSVMASSGQ